MTYRIVVVGGGTAGVMAATYFKSYWGDLVDVTTIYDHKNPGIGVGESLTPLFDIYLKNVGVSTVDLVKNCNATIKLGLKFKNWVNEGSCSYHSFPLNEAVENLDSTSFEFGLVDAYDILHDRYDFAHNYGYYYFENKLIPNSNNSIYRHALHVDATRLGRYIESLYKDKIKILDGLVTSVKIENRSIKKLETNLGISLEADLFIDASGLERVLMKHLQSDWIDVSKDLPTNRTIPNPLFKEDDELPPYTTAEATKNGWILDVPLSNRRGTGYVYSSDFMSDEEAKQDFNSWLLKTHGKELGSDRVIKFSNGYWKEQWVGNCIAVGLASGFIEPLEATNLHHTVAQLNTIVSINSLKNLNLDRENYNQFIRELYENSFRYIRFFYHTKRTDSEFWNHMTNNTPDWLKDLEEKIQETFLTRRDVMASHMFDHASFTAIAYGHGHFKNKDNIRAYLDSRYFYSYAELMSDRVRSVKTEYLKNAVDHKTWIKSILASQN